MTFTRYCKIHVLEEGIIPFTDTVYPDKNNHFQQDNDPKHTRKYTSDFITTMGIKWRLIPPANLPS